MSSQFSVTGDDSFNFNLSISKRLNNEKKMNHEAYFGLIYGVPAPIFFIIWWNLFWLTMHVRDVLKLFKNGRHTVSSKRASFKYLAIYYLGGVAFFLLIALLILNSNFSDFSFNEKGLIFSAIKFLFPYALLANLPPLLFLRSF